MDITLIHLDPDEAKRREESFLGNLAEAQDDYEWIVDNQAWTGLGFDSFADWWTTRVQPQMRALSMRPTREIAARVIEQVRAEEAELPPAQRRTQRELGELAGVSSDTVARFTGSRSAPAADAPPADLEQDSPPSSGVTEGNEEAPGREQTPAQAGAVLDPPFVAPTRREPDRDAIDRDRRLRHTFSFAQSLVAIWSLIEPDPYAFLERTWLHDENPHRMTPGARDVFTGDGLRLVAKRLAELADRADELGGAL